MRIRRILPLVLAVIMLAGLSTAVTSNSRASAAELVGTFQMRNTLTRNYFDSVSRPGNCITITSQPHPSGGGSAWMNTSRCAGQANQFFVPVLARY